MQITDLITKQIIWFLQHPIEVWGPTLHQVVQKDAQQVSSEKETKLMLKGFKENHLQY